jgi:hypothetical protein
MEMAQFEIAPVTIDLIAPHVAEPVQIEHYTAASTVRFG